MAFIVSTVIVTMLSALTTDRSSAMDWYNLFSIEFDH